VSDGRADVQADLHQRTPNIQGNTLRKSLQCLLKVRQMLPLIDGTEPHNVYRQQSILEVRRQLRNHKRLVDDGAHGHLVVAGLENEVAEGGVANQGLGAVDVVIEGAVAHSKGHHGGVGDEDGADHIGAVGVGGELDGEVGHVETRKLIEACA